MIAPEQRAEIRRLFYAEHWRVGTIATTLGVHHDTVHHAIERDRFVRTGTQVRPSALDPYKAFLAATLEPYPRLRATRLHAMLRERGYAGSAVQVRRYVRTIRPAARAEAYLRLETLPGEQAQVDWGNFGAFPVGGARRALSCFVLVLSWSRAVYARFALDQTLESFLRGHVEAFTALGGVPRTILYDNLKSVVLERVGDHIRFHPRLLELAGHYHFAPQPCAPYRANEKAQASYCTPFRLCDAHCG
jgi:transposase